MKKIEKLKNNGFVVSLLKGCLVAIVISLVGILFFAFIVKMFGIADQFLKPINQVIKAISILVGVFVCLKTNRQKGLVSGLIVGILYTILAIIIFSLLNGNFAFDKSLLNDVIFGGITGAICGIIAVNFKKTPKNA